VTTNTASGAILIYAPDEHTREAFKSALNKHLPLIVTESRGQCLAALAQKAPIKKAFFSACTVEGNADMELFERISASNPGLKMIAVGDHATESITMQAVRHGATGYIILPVKAGELLTLAR
jgi:DNA-binding NtrC family response regulator